MKLRFNLSRDSRRALAPLEFVLWLPVLLFVMALMVNLGTMTAWRDRGEIVARDAVWRARWPRSGENEPRPKEHVWPRPAEIDVADGQNIGQLDQLANGQNQVVRGPLPNGFEVNDHLKPDVGMNRGISSINRQFPLLPKVGSYKSGEIQHPLMDNRWQVAQMGLPNSYRRTNALYEYPEADDASLADAYKQAVKDILGMGNRADLNPLDNDEDFRRYQGGAPDFHPRAPRMCETDREKVHDRLVNPAPISLLDDEDDGDPGRISLLPETMARAFLSMYRNALQQMQQAQDMGQTVDAAEMGQLQQNIQQVQDFLDSVQQ